MTSPEQNIVIIKSLGYNLIQDKENPFKFNLSLGNGFWYEINVKMDPGYWKANKDDIIYDISDEIVPVHGRETAKTLKSAYETATKEQELFNAPEEPKPEPKDLTEKAKQRKAAKEAIKQEEPEQIEDVAASKPELTLEEQMAILEAIENGEIKPPASKKPEPKKQEPKKEAWKSPTKTNSKPTDNIIDAQYVDYSTVDVPNLPAPVGIEIVRPAVTAQQALAAWREFQELKKYIIEPSDLQEIVTTDKRTGEKKKSTFVKKSGWRKFATFYNLTDRIVEEIKEPTATNGYLWKIKVVCTAPNGRETEGVGMCSSSERGFAHPDHDIYSTAHTRAKNRAISDMIAAGEVSYEEVA